MGLFGLGDFGTGFVEGFAKSANEALKEDLRKVDLRVEKVAEAKMKRALKQQEERAEELKDIEDALEQGRSLFGTDDPRSAQYAASLLKQEGNLASYKSLISQLQEQTKNSSINLTDYIQRAEIDSPTGTISDYAKSFQGAAKTLPSYKLPDDIESAGAGSLLSAIGLDQDVSGQIQRNVSEQLAAEGITAEELPNIDVPTLAFDMEGVRMFNMTPSERVTFLKQELSRPGNTEERKQELRGDLQAGLLSAQKAGDDVTQLNSIDMQLGYEQDPTKIAGLQAQRKAVDRRIKLKTATNEKDRLLLESGFAAEDGDAQKAVELARKAEDFGTVGPLLPESLKRMQDDNMRNISDHRNTGGTSGYAADSEEAKAAQVQINALKQTIEGTKGAKELDMSTYKIASATVHGEIKLLISNSPELSQYYEFRPGAEMPTFKAGMKEDNQAKATARLRQLRKTTVDNLIETFPEGSMSRIAHEAVKNNMVRAGLIEGSVAAPPVETKTETSRTPVRTVTPSGDAVEEVVYEDGSIETVVAGTNTPVKSVGAIDDDMGDKDLVKLNATQKKFPKTAEGIKSLLDSVDKRDKAKNKKSSDEDIKEAVTAIHGEKFANIVVGLKQSGIKIDSVQGEIALLSLEGKDRADIIKAVKTKYPTFDVFNLAAEINKVLTQIDPKNASKRQANREIANQIKEAQRKKQEAAIKKFGKNSGGLMTRKQ